MKNPPHTKKIMTSHTNWKAGYMELVRHLNDWEAQERNEAREAAASDEHEYAKVCHGHANHLRVILRAGASKLLER